MHICRQPTIRSLFFVIALVAVVLACGDSKDWLYLISSEDPLFSSVYHGLVLGSLVVFYSAPIVISLLVQRYSIIMALSLALFVLGLACAPFMFRPQIPDSAVDMVGVGVIWPLMILSRKFSLATEPWMLVPYGVIHLSIGPAFAWTCRLRPRSQPLTSDPR